ncbi:TetR/AcrR family transcriptional regulator [Longispora sp. NPDC051575]|uniref:TetR/AcrR family transcriptional regulator n=1 Tax=Longispora sp. NPDC051575 TaxID=3154943 RepID=UPI00341DC922
MKTSETAGRHRNPRGEGGRLRGEILSAATALIVRTGSDEAVTLRSVAREVGISAPSIYSHFADRDAIIAAVVEEALEQLAEAVRTATAEHTDPVDRLLAGCAAYVDHSTRESARYQVLFGFARQKAELADDDGKGPEFLGGFDLLVDGVTRCAEAGRSASTDPFADAVLIWTALHGQVVLRANIPFFPWPPDDGVEQLVLRLARISA